MTLGTDTQNRQNGGGTILCKAIEQKVRYLHGTVHHLQSIEFNVSNKTFYLTLYVTDIQQANKCQSYFVQGWGQISAPHHLLACQQSSRHTAGPRAHLHLANYRQSHRHHAALMKKWVQPPMWHSPTDSLGCDIPERPPREQRRSLAIPAKFLPLGAQLEIEVTYQGGQSSDL